MKRNYFGFFLYAVVLLLVAACAGLRTKPTDDPPAPREDSSGEGYPLWVASHAEFLTQDRVPIGWWQASDPYIGPFYYLVATSGEICKVADATSWAMAIEGERFTCAWRRSHE